MNRKYRLFKHKGMPSATLLSLLLAFLLLAGCSPSTPAPTNSSEPTPAGTTTPTPSALPNVPPDSYGGSRPVASLSYVQAEAERVLTAESAAMVIYPEDGTVIREIPEGTLLTVLAEATSEKRDWLLIRMQDLRSPSDLIGWIEKGKALAYDDSMMGKLVSPVLLPAGTEIHPASSDGGILWDSVETQGADTYGSVLRSENGWLLLALSGGAEVWAAEDAVQAGYP